MKDGGRTVDRLVLLAAVLLGVLHLVVLPPWMGEDEPWHVEYVHHVANGHVPGPPARAWTRADLAEHASGILWARDHMPSLEYAEAEAYQREVLASMREHRFAERVDLDPRHANPRGFDEVQPEDPYFDAFAQPRLYYLVVGALVRLSGASDPASELFVARCFSFLCYLATVGFALGLARVVFDDPRAVFLAAATVVLVPMHARQAAVVNNDVLAKAMSAGVLYFATRFALGRSGPAGFLAAIAFVAVGVLAKTTAAGGLGVLALSVVVRAVRARAAAAPDRPRSRRDGEARPAGRGVTILLLVLLVLLTAGAVVYWLESLSPALPKTPAKFVRNLREVLSTHSLLELWSSTVGTTNWNTRLLPGALYLSVGIGAALAFASALVVGCGRRAWIARPGLLISLAAIAIQLVLLVLRGKALGRYWMPVLPAFGVVLAAGCLGPLSERLRDHAVRIVLVLVVLYEGWYLWGALIVNHYLVWGA